MPLPFRLMLITDWSVGAQRVTEVVSALGASGRPLVVQHRHPEATTAQFFAEARALAPRCPLFVNGRIDIALALGTHLHLGAQAISVDDARAALPAGKWLSAAVHSEAECLRAARADLVLVSPVFAPRSKPDDRRQPLGVDGFRELAARSPCPAFALGGVTPETAAALRGVAGAACMTDVWREADPIAWVDRVLDSLC